MGLTQAGIFWEAAMKVVSAAGFSSDERGLKDGARRWRDLLGDRATREAHDALDMDYLARACEVYRAGKNVLTASEPTQQAPPGQVIAGSVLAGRSESSGYQPATLAASPLGGHSGYETQSSTAAEGQDSPQATADATSILAPPAGTIPDVLAGVTREPVTEQVTAPTAATPAIQEPVPTPAAPEGPARPAVVQQEGRIEAWRRIPKFAEEIDTAHGTAVLGEATFADLDYDQDRTLARMRKRDADIAFQESRIAGRLQANEDDRIGIARSQSANRADAARAAEREHQKNTLRAHGVATLPELPREAQESLGLILPEAS